MVLAWALPQKLLALCLCPHGAHHSSPAHRLSQQALLPQVRELCADGPGAKGGQELEDEFFAPLVASSLGTVCLSVCIPERTRGIEPELPLAITYSATPLFDFLLFLASLPLSSPVFPGVTSQRKHLNSNLCLRVRSSEQLTEAHMRLAHVLVTCGAWSCDLGTLPPQPMGLTWDVACPLLWALLLTV